MLAYKKGIVFQGGGVLGISYIGALKELKKQGIKADHFAGSSIGSVTALLMACNVDLDLLEKYVLELDISSCVDNVNYVTAMWRLCYYNGWHDINVLKKKLKLLLKTIVGKDDITFAGIEATYGNHLGMMAFSMEDGTTHVFDPIQTPNKKVIDACIESCTVPFFFMSNKYVDGGLDDNYPIKYMNSLIGQEKTLGLELINDKTVYKKPTSFYDFTKFMIGKVFDNSMKTHLSVKDSQDTIRVHISADMSFLNFGLTIDEKRKLIEDGRVAVVKYMSDCN